VKKPSRGWISSVGLAIGVVLIVLGFTLVTAISGGHQNQGTPMSGPQAERPVAVPTSGSPEEAAVFGGETLEQLVESMDATDKALATKAAKEHKNVQIFRYPDGRVVLIGVGGKQLRPDPGADKRFRDGYTSQPDPKADTEFWSKVASETTGVAR
jgi:hypothetical protein